MRIRGCCILLLAACGSVACVDVPAAPAAARSIDSAPVERMRTTPGSELRDAVAATERAFAKSMADRDLEAFGRFVAEDAVFFSGPGEVLRGRAAVIASWKTLFTATAAPFSWEPDEVEVLDSGTLALSSGPVRDASGKQVGRFNSIWRREPDGRWRIVFDKGERACECGAASR